MQQKGELIRVKIEDLEVGDKICVAREVREGGWYCFRYPMFVECTVVRITPKKTKLVTDKCGNVDKYTPIYIPNEETERQTKISKAFKNLDNTISELVINRNKSSLRSLNDETIMQLEVKVQEIKDILRVH